MTSLVLPAFNPGIGIEQTWLAVRRFLDARDTEFDPWEIVFVLDGCTDGTPELLARLVSKHDANVCVLNYPTNRGKGFAVRAGLLAARGTIRIFTDVDLAYPFEDVLRLAMAIRAGASVAIGSRSHPESRLEVPLSSLGYAFRRAIQGRLFGAVARVLLPISHRDTQAGLKGMTADIAESLLPHLSCDGFGFDCELLTACARSGVLVTEVPVRVRYDDTKSTTSPRSSLRMLRDLWRIRRAWWNRSVPIVVTSRLPLPEPTHSRTPAAA